AGLSTDLEIFQPIAITLQPQCAVAIPGFDVMFPEARIFQHVAVGIDRVCVLQAMDGAGIEHRLHDRSSPAIVPWNRTLCHLLPTSQRSWIGSPSRRN